MTSPKASKRTSAAQHSDPLSDAGILEHVLGYVGPGVYLYIGAVSSLWKQCYEKVALRFARQRWRGIPSDPPRQTMYRAVMQSVETLNWAYTSGLRVDASRAQELQYAAGRHASSLTLALAQELGIPMSAKVFTGAVASGRAALVDHLYTTYHCPMEWDLGFSPAKKGNISMLRYLKQRGYELHASLAWKAALAGHLDTMKYLHSEGVSWLHYRDMIGSAVQSGNLELVSKYSTQTISP
jgi:hypothetical protein